MSLLCVSERTTAIRSISRASRADGSCCRVYRLDLLLAARERMRAAEAVEAILPDGYVDFAGAARFLGIHPFTMNGWQRRGKVLLRIHLARGLLRFVALLLLALGIFWLLFGDSVVRQTAAEAATSIAMLVMASSRFAEKSAAAV